MEVVSLVSFTVIISSAFVVVVEVRPQSQSSRILVMGIPSIAKGYDSGLLWVVVGAEQGLVLLMSFAFLEADQFEVTESQTSHHLDIFTLVFPFGPKYPLRWIGTLVRNLFIAATTAGDGFSC